MPDSTERRDAAQVTRWRVYALPRMDGVEVSLTLSTPSTDPKIVEAIERAAALNAMVIERLASDAA